MDIYDTIEFLEKHLKISQDELDSELIKQPELSYMASKEVALATSKRDALKENLKQTHAELYLKHRMRLEEGAAKVTETVINSHVETDPVYKKEKLDFLESNVLVETLLALKETYNQRAWMLRELCGMYVSGMSASSRVSGSPSLGSKVTDKIIEDRRLKIRQASDSKK